MKKIELNKLKNLLLLHLIKKISILGSKNFFYHHRLLARSVDHATVLKIRILIQTKIITHLRINPKLRQS